MAYRQNSSQGRQDRWCIRCQCSMELVQRQSCALPIRVVTADPTRGGTAGYGRHLMKVNSDSDVPAGMCACGAHLYRCPECGRRKARLTLFLPTGQETFLFEHGELDGVFH